MHAYAQLKFAKREPVYQMIIQRLIVVAQETAFLHDYVGTLEALKGPIFTKRQWGAFTQRLRVKQIGVQLWTFQVLPKIVD